VGQLSFLATAFISSTLGVWAKAGIAKETANVARTMKDQRWMCFFLFIGLPVPHIVRLCRYHTPRRAGQRVAAIFGRVWPGGDSGAQDEDKPPNP